VWAITVFIVMVISITGIMLFNREKVGELSTNTALIVEEKDGWQRIDHPAYNISFSVPGDWGISIFELGKGSVVGLFNNQDTNAQLEIYKIQNVNDLTLGNLVERSSFSAVEDINVGGVLGVQYLGKHIPTDVGDEGIEGENLFIEDSYLIGSEFIIDRDILTITCSAVGSKYVEYISVCNDIVNSLQIRQ